ncbi:MAG TPA: NrfD/PsrC family molybdoenzyme membrane anchor subunit [Devosia sp.]
MASDPPRDPPVLSPGATPRSIPAAISAIPLGPKLPRRFWWGFGFFFALTLVFLFSVTWVLVEGIGTLGLDIPAAWAFPIINTVWWIGIGHAGTLISAVLLLLRQRWRNSINRFAEAMTLLAASLAAFHPILHLGRPQYFYWLLPLPVTHMPWPQWRSPLVWDFFAIGTYLIVSLLFWYMGLIPDLAVLRDRAKRRGAQVAYGLLALGWRGSAHHWHRFETAYFLIAALATPLVVSVHSVIALDFTSAIIPGYHSTIFPPYFVAGALYSGFAMVVTIAVPLRAFFGLEAFITLRHIDNAARVMLGAGGVVAFGYVSEAYFAWYSGDEYERYMIWNRAFGDYGWLFWTMLACNVGALQLLWFRSVRRSQWTMFALAMVINIGMWIERYVIVVTSLTRDFLPSAWNTLAPTWTDFGLLAGSLGLFFALMFLFVRLLPALSISEVEELQHELKEAG